MDLPSQKQLDYARDLGLDVEMLRGLTRIDVARAIDIKVQEKNRKIEAENLANREQEIARRKFVVGAKVTVGRRPRKPEVFVITKITPEFRIYIRGSSGSRGPFNPLSLVLVEDS